MITGTHVANATDNLAVLHIHADSAKDIGDNTWINLWMNL